MSGARTAYCMALLLLGGCEATRSEGDDEAGAEMDPDPPDSGTDAGSWTSANDWCRYEWGAVLTTAADGAQVLWSTAAQRATGSAAPLLRIAPDRVEARTRAGMTYPCRSGLGSYDCSPPRPYNQIVVIFGEHEWGFSNRCLYEEDPHDLAVDLDCVAAGTIVVEGELLGYDPDRAAPQVTLEGPEQTIPGSSGLGSLGNRTSVVGTHCTVQGGHFACPTVGFPQTEKHAVVAGGTRTEVQLPVADCTAEPVRIDVTCPDEPEGLFVAAPARDISKVTASYEGGEPYACTKAKRTAQGPAAFNVPLIYPRHDYVCPPAPGDERGRGTYHVVGVDYMGREYKADASDVFDGCGGSREPVVLSL